jgi:anti-sigma regulatory factor (Ser/Thr protein kinase)
MTPTRIDLELPAAPEAPSMARRALSPLRGAVSQTTMADLQLLVSELVTNSIRHAGLSPPASVALNVRLAEQRVRVEVTDAGPGFDRPPPPPHPV